MQQKVMKYLWEDVVHSVTHKNVNRVEIVRQRLALAQQGPPLQDKRRRGARRVWIAEKNKYIYFTKRELETLKWLMRQCTVKQAARHMGLSHRTVEFYVKNVRSKLDCKNKHRLLKKIELHGWFKEL